MCLLNTLLFVMVAVVVVVVVIVVEETKVVAVVAVCINFKYFQNLPAYLCPSNVLHSANIISVYG